MNEALGQLHRAVEPFVAYIHGLPPDQLAPAAWGPREVLVHLVFWHETFVFTIQALLDLEQPRLPRGTFAQFNAAAIRANAAVPLPNLVERFRAAQARLESLALGAGGHPLAIPVKEGSRPRTFDQLMAEADAHIRNHERKLRRRAGRG